MTLGRLVFTTTLFFVNSMLFSTGQAAEPMAFVTAENQFSIQSANGDNQLRFNGLVQTDQDIFMDTHGLTINNGTASKPILNSDTVDRIWMSRVRPILSGTLLKYYDFFMAPDFGQGQTRLFDAFADVHYQNALNFRVGKQISPLTGQDFFRFPGTLFSMEAGYSTMLAPNREIGFMIYGSFSPYDDPKPRPEDHYDLGFNDWIFYQIGVFSGTSDSANPGLNPVSTTGFSTDSATLENKAVELRIFTNPFKGSNLAYLEGFGAGIAGGYDNPDNQVTLPAMLSVGQNPVFTYNPSIGANGGRRRIHPQVYWFLGPFGVMGEWAQTSQTLSNDLVANINNLPITSLTQKNNAGEVLITYNLTGEKNNFINRLNPNKPFNPKTKGAWGALQLVSRWSGLYMDDNVFNSSTTSGDQTIYTFSDPRISVQQANTWSIGLNWILNRNFSVTTEYDQTRFVGGCSTGAMSALVNPGCLTSGTAATASTSQVINRPDEKVIMQRVQIQF